MRRLIAIVALAALAVPASAGAQAPAAPVQLKDVTVSPQGGGVTVQLKTTGPARHEATLIDSPPRVVVDLQGIYGWSRSRLAPEAPPVREIRGSQFKPGVARVVIELTRKAAYRVEASPDGLTVVLDAPAAPRMAAAPPPARAEARPPEPAKAAARPAPDPPAARAEAVKTAAATTPPAPAPPPRPEPVTVAARPVVPSVVPAAAPAPPAFQVAQAQARNGRLLSLDFKDADVVNLLRILAAESGRNIVAGPDVRGKISISLRNVTWEQALDTILEVAGLRKVEKADVIRIVSLEQLTKEQEAQARIEEAKRRAEVDVRTKLAEAQIKEAELAARKLATEVQQQETLARGPLREETVRLRYADAEEIARTLQGIMGIPPEGTAPIPTAAVPAPTVPAEPTVVPSGGVSNPALGQLPNVPVQIAPPGSRGVVSVSQDVLAKGITIRAHKPTNSVFIRHYQADLERIKKLISEQLDVPLPQVKIEARMEVLDRNALEAIGVQWSGAGAGNVNHVTLVGQGFQSVPSGVPGQTVPLLGGFALPDGSLLVPAAPGAGQIGIRPGQIGGMPNPNLLLTGLLPVEPVTGLPLGAGNLVNLPIQAVSGGVPGTGGISFGIVGTRYNINLALQALATQGKTRTLARPEIVTVENNRALMSLGEEVPFSTVSAAGTQIQFKEALLKLEVTPTVVREPGVNKVKMHVIVENNSRGAVLVLGQPVINRRKAETQVVVREGERLVIGGVTQDEKADTIRKVPLLGDIPVLGWLFKQRGTSDTGRELVLFVTPTVLKVDAPRSSAVDGPRTSAADAPRPAAGDGPRTSAALGK
jgi:type II secretory pathway component HofQ